MAEIFLISIQTSSANPLNYLAENPPSPWDMTKNLQALLTIYNRHLFTRDLQSHFTSITNQN